MNASRWTDDFISLCRIYVGEFAASKGITTDQIVFVLSPTEVVRQMRLAGRETFRSRATKCRVDEENMPSLEKCVFGHPAYAVEILAVLWPAAACFVPKTDLKLTGMALRVTISLSNGTVLNLNGVCSPERGDAQEAASLVLVGAYRIAQMLSSAGFSFETVSAS